jgi:ribonuclease G
LTNGTSRGTSDPGGSRRAPRGGSSRGRDNLTREILINDGDLESRVAILEDGRLAEILIEREARIVGNIYKAKIVNVVPGMDASFVDIGLPKNAFLALGDITSEEADAGRPRRTDKIADLVKKGQEVLVQIVRAPLGAKGARVSTRISLPGRFLVLALGDGGYVGVSRKIDTEEERQRLRKLGEELAPEGMGLIVRTEAEGQSVRELRKDLDFLMELHKRTLKKEQEVKAPALIHEDLPLISKVVRDVFNRQAKELVVDSRAAYETIMELLSVAGRQLRTKVRLYEEKMPLFAARGIEEEIDKLLRRRVGLVSGGHIAIDHAEGFVAIDVNTGRYTGGAGLAETILRTNLEAASEIARQLRLRDLGGIIVMDFIDMDKPKHRTQVMDAFLAALKSDRARTKVHHRISPLGLVEMTRKRTAESLRGTLCEACPYCGGSGAIRSPLTMALTIERDLLRQAAEDGGDVFLVRCHPQVSSVLVGFDGEHAEKIEKAIRKPLYIRSNPTMHLEQYEITALGAAQLKHEVTLLKQGQEVIGRLVGEPKVGAPAMFAVEGYHIGVKGEPPTGEREVRVRMEAVGHSYGEAVPVGQQPAGPPAGRKEAPPAGRKEAPPAGRKEAPPAGRKDAPPAGRKEAPPAGRKEAPPAGRKEAPPAGRKEAPPAEATKKPSRRRGRRGGRRHRKKPAAPPSAE